MYTNNYRKQIAFRMFQKVEQDHVAYSFFVSGAKNPDLWNRKVFQIGVV